MSSKGNEMKAQVNFGVPQSESLKQEVKKLVRKVSTEVGSSAMLLDPVNFKP